LYHPAIDAGSNPAGHASARAPAIPPTFRRNSLAPEEPQKSLTVAAWCWVKRTRRRLYVQVTVNRDGNFLEAGAFGGGKGICRKFCRKHRLGIRKGRFTGAIRHGCSKGCSPLL
jgi:hypothetical protein